MNDAVSKRNVEHVKHVIQVAQIEILKSKSYSSESRWIFCFLTEEAIFLWKKIRDISVRVLRIVSNVEKCC